MLYNHCLVMDNLGIMMWSFDLENRKEFVYVPS